MLNITQSQMDVFDDRACDVFVLKVKRILEKHYTEEIPKLGMADGELKIFIKKGIKNGERLGLKTDIHRAAFVVLSVYKTTRNINERAFGLMNEEIREDPNRVQSWIHIY